LSRHAKTNGIDADTLARLPLFHPAGVRPLERESREFRRANDLLFGTLCPVLGRWLTWLMGDELANDRTYLAWLRTGIALFGLGFVVAKVALIVQPDTKVLSDRGLYSGVGVLIVLAEPCSSWSATSNMWPWLKSSSATQKHHGPGGR
jgi:hypothetical protein